MPTTVLQPRGKEGDIPAAPLSRQPPRHPTISVLHYSPGRYIAVNKPADVRIDGEFEHTVSKLVLQHLDQLGDGESGEGEEGRRVQPRFIQRLDYATSGVLLIGLCRRAAAAAARQFERRKVSKEYVALVHGWLDGERVFDHSIADTVPRGFRMTVGTVGNPGRAAETRCVPVAHGWFRGARITKVRLVAKSGRRHQLRVHCAEGGVPIVGDATYIPHEGGQYFADDALVVGRMMLHARRLEVGLPEQPGWACVVSRVIDAGDPFVDARLPGLRLHPLFGGAGR